MILGIDPGSKICAFGIVNCVEKTFFYDFIKFKSLDNFDNRLFIVYQKAIEIVERYNINEAAIEDVFYSVNIKSSLKLSEIKGAAIVALKSKKVSVFHYSAREIKQAISGYGAASKSQLKFIIEKTFHTNFDKVPIDVSDALSIALTHCGYKHTASSFN